MYTKYFGLTKIPFGASLDATEFFYSSSARNNENAMVKAIKNHCPATFLYGDSGVGKTTLLQRLAHTLSPTHTFLFHNQRSSSVDAVIDRLYRAMGFTDPDKTVREKVTILHEYIANPETELTNLVLVVDGADELSPNRIANLIALAQVKKDRTQTFHIIFVGTGRFAKLADHSALQKYNPPEACWCHLEPMQDQEVHWFINQKLEAAGYRGKPLFDQDAVNQVIALSNGNPSTVGALCRAALLRASSEHLRVVSAEQVSEESADVPIPGDCEEMTATIEPNQDQATRLAPPLNSASPKKEEDTKGYSDPAEKRQSDITKVPANDRAGRENQYQPYQDWWNPTQEKKSIQRTLQKESPQPGLNSDFLSWIRRPAFAWTAMTTAILVGLVSIATFYLEPFKSGDSSLVADSDPQPPVAVQNQGAREAKIVQKRPPAENHQSKSSQTDARIDAMLLRAESQIASQRLFSPQGDNALETYRKIAKLVEHQMKTLNEIAEIEKLYRRLGLEAELQGAWAKAEKFYHQAANLSPHDTGLKEALLRVRTQQKDQDRGLIRSKSTEPGADLNAGRDEERNVGA